MKIWLDLRFIKDQDLYSDFIEELAIELIKNTPENQYIIYTNNDLKIKENKNVKLSRVNIKKWSLSEQTRFYKILKKDNNALMLFFDINKPLLYKKEYYIFIPTLSKVYYQDFKKYSQKYKYLYLLSKSVKNASKIKRAFIL